MKKFISVLLGCLSCGLSFIAAIMPEEEKTNDGIFQVLVISSIILFGFAWCIYSQTTSKNEKR